ncbi:cytochrome c oxidase subunit II [Roseimarinus sediminis]|jgi:cytochrome c oxidase subunit 2|uniref:cytochrome c oxidase subunit II n=1 Tax=Roseimarinus sediminis TaxID=1610899 RepID=UPI003D1CA217
MYENPDLAASNFVKGVDTAFVITFAISFFFLIAITATMIYFLFRYNKKKNPKATQIKGSTKLEIIWTVIPLILVLLMFYYGWAGWNPMRTAPKDAFVITAEARMWNFNFIYPNGKREKDLIIPINQPIKLDLVALDVIHSLYIPAFRVKEDMVPGREKMMWFTAQQIGEYDLFCAEYCGLNHSYMLSTVKVLSDSAFQSWYVDTTQVAASASGADPAQAGYDLMQQTGCFACHSVDGSKLVGPSYKGLFGSTRTVLTPSGEKEVTADEEYIHRSIYYPNAEIVDGFNRGLMLPYKDQLSNDDIDLMIEYLKTLSN